MTGNAVFSAGPGRSYWLAKWMTQGSHISYWVDQGGRVPVAAEEYVLEYTLNGRPGRWPSA